MYFQLKNFIFNVTASSQRYPRRCIGINVVKRKDEAWLYLKAIWGQGNFIEHAIPKTTLDEWESWVPRVVVKSLFKYKTS
jgi:hypothetical protein